MRSELKQDKIIIYNMIKKIRAQYPVFLNKNKQKLVFYPVKKNANTSAKLFFAKHLGVEDKLFFFEDEKPRYLHTDSDYQKYSGKYDLIKFFVGEYEFEEVDIEFKSCIIRDPIERFVSAYKNRVLYHKDKMFYNHSIDQIIEKLENGVFENNHFNTQSHYLGNSLKYFDVVGNVSNIKKFQDYINDFFNKKIIFPRLQTGGGDNQISLNSSQIKKIRKIYDCDYQLIETSE